jgi:regulatory protein
VHPFFYIMISISSLTYRENSISIILSNGETFTCGYSITSIMTLDKRPLNDEEYGILSEESALFNSRNKAYHYLSFRQRSEMEMTRYLEKKGFSKSTIEKTIEHLRERDYINDISFGISFVQSICNRKPAGKHLLLKKLYEKGIKGEDARVILSESGCLDLDFDTLYEMAEKKMNSIRNREKAREKVYRYLSSRGFDYDIITKILQSLDAHLKEIDED